MGQQFGVSVGSPVLEIGNILYVFYFCGNKTKKTKSKKCSTGEAKEVAQNLMMYGLILSWPWALDAWTEIGYCLKNIRFIYCNVTELIHRYEHLIYTWKCKITYCESRIKESIKHFKFVKAI